MSWIFPGKGVFTVNINVDRGRATFATLKSSMGHLVPDSRSPDMMGFSNLYCGDRFQGGTWFVERKRGLKKRGASPQSGYHWTEGFSQAPGACRTLLLQPWQSL